MTAGGPPRVSQTRKQSISVRRVNFHKVAAGLSGGGGLGEVAIRHIQDLMWTGNTRVVYKCNRYNIVAQDIYVERVYIHVQ